MSLLTINHIIIIWVHIIWSLLNYICHGKLCTCNVGCHDKKGLKLKDGHKNARSRPIILADRSHWNVVPFGMVYLLQLEFQRYCIWLCVREVNRLWNCKLLLCTLYRHGGISAPRKKSLSKSVGVNRAIFHDLVCTMWYSFRVSLMAVVPLPSQTGSWSLIFLFPYSDGMWHNYNGWTKTLFQFMCSYINVLSCTFFIYFVSSSTCMNYRIVT